MIAARSLIGLPCRANLISLRTPAPLFATLSAIGPLLALFALFPLRLLRISFRILLRLSLASRGPPILLPAKTVDQIGAREATKLAHRAKPIRVAKGCEEQFEVIAKETQRTAQAEDRLRKVSREEGC